MCNIDERQEELNEIIKKFKESRFYEEYRDKYVSDVILKKVLDSDLRLHRLRGLKTYSDVHSFNVKVMTDFIKLFKKPMQIENDAVLWQMLQAFYVDPDSCAVKELNGIQCSADGLISIARIYGKFGITETAVCEYDRYRKIPIFYFPQERNGINMSRATIFGDKIDHTLFDLKRYYQEGAEKCKLANAFKLSKTAIWLRDMGSFEALVDWYGVKGIFVNDSYEVFDLEKEDGSFITEYKEVYRWRWSDFYYDNLKKKIDEFMCSNM